MGPDQNELSIHGALKVDFDHCTEIDPGKKNKHRQKKSSTKKQTLKTRFSLEPWVRKTNVHHWRLMPTEGCNFTYNFFTCMHASVSRTLTARLLRGCRCIVSRSKAIHIHPMKTPHCPTPKILPFYKKLHGKKQPAWLHVWDVLGLWLNQRYITYQHGNQVLITPLGPAPWSEMYECSHLLCPRLAIRDACLKYPQKKTWHKSTSLCCQKESSQDAAKMVLFYQEIMLWYQCCSNNTNWNFD